MKQGKYVENGNYMISSALMDSICSEPIVFEGREDEQAIAIFVKLHWDLNVCMAIGDFEHTSDWDPYIEIKFRDGTKVESAPGYFQFDISDTESRGYPEDPKQFEVWLPTCSTEHPSGDDKFVFTIGDIKEIKVFK
tara:strand:+ start:148 stop:555 length:408 start_codon:yes stop_codon:yes gene_type:complete